MKYSDANALYETFQGFHPTQRNSVPLLWPEQFSLLGRALDISYRSAKAAGGGDGTEADYIHFHETPCALLCGFDPQLDPAPWLAPPPKNEFAVLGWCLEVSFYSDRFGERTLEFLHAPQFPYLGADPSKGMLTIVPPWGGDPLIIYGPQLRVESRGIVG